MTYEHILTRTEGRVGIAQLNRPKALNALNRELMAELMNALAQFDADPAVGAMEHIWNTNVIRLWATTRAKPIVWTCGRQANAERKLQGKRHQVDAEVLFEGDRIAVEVEISRKSKPRLIKILSELRDDYDATWYFVADNCYDFVTDMIAKQPRHEEFFVAYRLNKVAAELYEQYADSGKGAATVS